MNIGDKAPPNNDPWKFEHSEIEFSESSKKKLKTLHESPMQTINRGDCYDYFITVFFNIIIEYEGCCKQVENGNNPGIKNFQVQIKPQNVHSGIEIKNNLTVGGAHRKLGGRKPV